jgi:hypothetical protein
VVTTDAILAAARNHPDKIGCAVNRVEKIIGSAEKNRVGREPEPQVFFFTPKRQILVNASICSICFCQ